MTDLEKVTFDIVDPLTGEVLTLSGSPNDVGAGCILMIRELYKIKDEALKGAGARAVKAKQENPLLSNTFREDSKFGKIKIELKQDPKITTSDLKWIQTYTAEVVREKTSWELDKKVAKKMMSTNYDDPAKKHVSDWLNEKFATAPIEPKVSLEVKK